MGTSLTGVPSAGGGRRIGSSYAGEASLYHQVTPVPYTAANPALVAADLAGGIIVYNNGAGGTVTLPTAVAMDTALTNAQANDALDFTIVSIGAGTGTVTTNTGWTLTNAPLVAVAANKAVRYRALKTAAGAWSLYQISGT